MKIRIGIFGFLLFLGLANCRQPKGDPAIFDCSSEMVTWSNYAGSVLVGTCAIEGCHDKMVHESDHDFTDYESTKKSVLPDSKRLIGAIQHTEGYKYMPLNDYRMPESVVKKISCWVQNGMPE